MNPKPCPFCGGRARLHLIGHFGMAEAHCIKDWCAGYDGPIRPSKQEAVEAWNKRPEPPPRRRAKP
jgi:Lar family restriction alleviation protein